MKDSCKMLEDFTQEVTVLASEMQQFYSFAPTIRDVKSELSCDIYTGSQGQQVCETNVHLNLVCCVCRCDS